MFHFFDTRVIHFFRTISVPFSRVALFVIYAWFGFLKIIGLSPASPLVAELFHRTISFMDVSTFIILLGFFEVAIGMLFLIKGAERIAILLFFVHMITTIMPLFLLPHIAWAQSLVPTLEGQYIIKNLALMAAAINIGAHLHPMSRQ